MALPPELPESNNPYQSPVEAVETYHHPEDAGSYLVAEPKKLPASAGINWIKNAFTIYKDEWLMWIGMTVVFFIVLVVLNIIPIINLVAGFLTLHFTAGLVVGAHNQVENGKLEFSDLFSGFSTHFVPLLLVNLLYVLAIIVAMIPVIIIVAVVFGSSLMSGDINALSSSTSIGFLLFAILLFFILFIPCIMLIWFAPALVVLNDVEPVEAVKMSFKGTKRNFGALIVYLLVGSLFAMVFTIITFGLGILVVAPVMYITSYTSYLDVWVEEA